MFYQLDDTLTKKLTDKLKSINVNEILQRSPKSNYCYENNFAISNAKSFVTSVIHIESFNHLNDLCIQAYQKETRKKITTERTKNFGQFFKKKVIKINFYQKMFDLFYDLKNNLIFLFI